MAWTGVSSCWFGDTLKEVLGQTAAYDLNDGTAGRFRIHLYTTSLDLSAFNRSTASGSTAASPFNANECSYSGATPATYQVLTTPALASASGVLKWYDSGASSVAWTGATFTPYGALVRDNTRDRGLVLINFGADKIVVGGSLTITWDSTYGIGSIAH